MERKKPDKIAHCEDGDDLSTGFDRDVEKPERVFTNNRIATGNYQVSVFFQKPSLFCWAPRKC